MPRQAIILPSLEDVEIIETPMPVPGAKDVVIKVMVSGSNPKDWKYPLWWVLSLRSEYRHPNMWQEELAAQQRRRHCRRSARGGEGCV
jgi:hypothetical protein